MASVTSPLRLLRLGVAAVSLLVVTQASAQIQLDIKFRRLQYIAYEPVMVTLGITNLAGRDIELHDADGQTWFGFEVTGAEGQPIAPVKTVTQPPLRIEAGKRVTQKIDISHSFCRARFRCLSCESAHLFH